MEQALVSVIMPFYNAAPYLGEAVESVLRQTDARWELLLADDGSSDGSTAIAERYARAFPGKIYLLRHPGTAHRGTAAARNLAIDAARGDYLAFLDADDVWLPGKLAYQLALARRHPEAALICGATWYWYSWADGQKTDQRIPVGGPQDMLLAPPASALALYPLGDGAAPCLCSILVTRQAASRYRDLEEHFSGRNQLYEDQAFLVRIYLQETVYISSRTLDLYRQRPDSTRYSLMRDGHYNRVRHYFLEWLGGYLDDNGIGDPAVRKKLREARRLHWHRRVRQKIQTLSAGMRMKTKSR